MFRYTFCTFFERVIYLSEREKAHKNMHKQKG